MSSPGGTATAPEWWFILHPVTPPTEEQSDQFDHADSLAGGEIGWEEDPHGTRFPCAVVAPHLEEAVAWAVERMTELGMPIARVEVSPNSIQAIDSPSAA